MRSLPILIIALMIAVIVPHACAENVTYPQEYYDLNKQADDLWAGQNTFITYDYKAIQSVMWKLKANQIALEKQNELINEQNELLGKIINQTYTVHYSHLGTYQVETKEGIYQIEPNH